MAVVCLVVGADVVVVSVGVVVGRWQQTADMAVVRVVIRCWAV